MRRIIGGLLLAALGTCGSWHAVAVVMPPPTNRVALIWGSLGPGTRYYVQTSTNLLTWTAATNTTSTNVTFTSVGDLLRTFRLSASNTPPPAATLTWNASVPATGVTNYSIYYGVSSGNYTNQVQVGLGTNAVVTNLVAGTTYYFAATSHSSAGLESDFSNEAAWLAQNTLRLQVQRLP